MSWRDREYNQSKYSGGTGNSLLWLVTGSVPLFRVFGIRVRIHAFMIIFMLLTIPSSAACRGLSFPTA